MPRNSCSAALSVALICLPSPVWGSTVSPTQMRSPQLSATRRLDLALFARCATINIQQYLGVLCLLGILFSQGVWVRSLGMDTVRSLLCWCLGWF